MKPTPRYIERHAARTTARRVYSVPEAAEALGIGRSHAYELAKRGEIPTLRLGSRLVVPVAALDRMLNGDAA